ncbi:MAG TPA: DUF4350 domain-containing protein [Candidatus Angelobacter sp.]|nr:DUF4350 domain-containing protein [Candidatus Angelobacter sp.]
MTLLDARPRPSAAPVTPTVRARLRANRGSLVVAGLVLVGALLLAIAQSSRTVGLLDPDATDPSGSHATAALLEAQGVSIVRVTTAQSAAEALARVSDATLVVAPTAPVSDRMLARVSVEHPAYVVLLQPDERTLAAYAPWARPGEDRTSTDEVAAGCDWSVAVLAGPLPPTGAAYTTTRPDVSSCWGGGVLDGTDGRGGTVTVVGLAGALTNAHLAESGNAAMALGALGRAGTVVWWLPSNADPLQFDPGAPVGIEALVPSWVRWALVQLALAVLLVVWWRARRLGRVVVEPLPVVVRATESVEGRARLYRRGNARDRAAAALRAAALTRLRTRLALPRGAGVDVVTAAVTARTGRPGPEVAALLAPDRPLTDDADLTGLADALDALENEVRRS